MEEKNLIFCTIALLFILMACTTPERSSQLVTKQENVVQVNESQVFDSDEDIEEINSKVYQFVYLTSSSGIDVFLLNQEKQIAYLSGTWRETWVKNSEEFETFVQLGNELDGLSKQCGFADLAQEFRNRASSFHVKISNIEIKNTLINDDFAYVNITYDLMDNEDESEKVITLFKLERTNGTWYIVDRTKDSAGGIWITSLMKEEVGKSTMRLIIDQIQKQLDELKAACSQNSNVVLDTGKSESFREYVAETREQNSEENTVSQETILNECDFSQREFVLDNFILDREELPLKFSERNSWGDYNIKIRAPLIKDTSDSDVFAQNVSYNISRTMDVSFERTHVSVNEYKSVEKASDYLALRYDAVRKAKGTMKEDTGAYGEERLEYASGNGPYGITHYSIFFRIKNFLVLIDEGGAFMSPENVIFTATAVHNKLCNE